MSSLTLPTPDHTQNLPAETAIISPPSVPAQPALPAAAAAAAVGPPPKSVQAIKGPSHYGELKPLPLNMVHYNHPAHLQAKDGVGPALSDTPMPSHPGSPREYVEALRFSIPLPLLTDPAP